MIMAASLPTLPLREIQQHDRGEEGRYIWMRLWQDGPSVQHSWGGLQYDTQQSKRFGKL